MMAWKVVLNHQRRSDEWEFKKMLNGDFMALEWNLQADTRKHGAKSRKDFYPLSYDTQLTEEIDPDLFNKVARRLGSRIKGKDGNE